MTRVIGDLAVDPTLAEPHDYVVLNRVVCCYPDVERLLAAAAEHARSAVVLSHPPRNALSRSLLAVENVALALVRLEYRTYVHSPGLMRDVLRTGGFESEYVSRGAIWQVLAATPSSERIAR
jgi:magnesium-protoporphyrin O-methyltransferase